ncbi:MAG: Bax inhibitor-1/YccA family protein, partial [Candidatus Poseidoniaceae archaeon]|nr:Bax inhibitor-1/YccA family protein [Candidatus Poseidoniaceae archaeon]
MMRSSNPFLNKNSFQRAGVRETERMTLEGVANRTGMLLMVVLICAAATWIITWDEIRAVQSAIDS